MQTNQIELFDTKGRFKMPTPEAVAALDPTTQANFAAVSEAALELEQKTAERIAAEQGVEAALIERNEAENELLRVRPKITEIQNAKAEILAARRD